MLTYAKKDFQTCGKLFSVTKKYEKAFTCKAHMKLKALHYSLPVYFTYSKLKGQIKHQRLGSPF